MDASSEGNEVVETGVLSESGEEAALELSPIGSAYPDDLPNEPLVQFRRREMLPEERSEVRRHATHIWRRPLYGAVVLFLGAALFSRWLLANQGERAIGDAMPILGVSFLLGWVAAVLMFFYFLGSLRESQKLRRDSRRGVIHIFLQADSIGKLGEALNLREIEALPSAERQWSINGVPVRWRKQYPARVHDLVLAD